MHALKPYWLATFSIFGLLLVRVLALPSNIINPDCSMFLQTGQLVIAGARPYIDFIELNPPLVFYINAIPAFLVKLSGLPADTSLYIFTLVLFACSLLLCWNLLKDGTSDAVKFGPVLLAFCLGNLLCYEWVQFGQRQQLLANALLPFFVCRYLRWQGVGTKIDTTTAAISGLYCGTMTGLLPQYATIIVCLELFYILRQRRLRPLISAETIAFVGSVLAYGLFVYSQEAIRVEFLGRWMPMVSQGYGLYNWPWPMQILQLTASGILPISAIALLITLKMKPWKQQYYGLLPNIGVFCLGSALVLLLQGKSILNQTIPLMYGSLMLCCAMPLANNFKRTLLTALISLLCFMLPVWALPGVISQNQTWQIMTTKIAATLQKESSSQDRVSMLTLSLPDSYPALAAAKRESGSRYFFVFPLLMTTYLAKKHAGTKEAEKWQVEGQKFVSDLDTDLHNNKPRIILIQENIVPMADISVRQYLEKTHFWQTLEQNYEYAYQLKAGPSDLSLWKRRIKPKP
ncbi:MAG: hypothetical protein Q8T09_22185 [Candidatus Melainabacteria bacterium]|nr:hypothetical protein [Candidatus Melainabacteria bacterium]